MKVSYRILARNLGLPPLQVLTELAALGQPWEECWPNCEDEWEPTIRDVRRRRMGLPATGAPRLSSAPSMTGRAEDRLPVSAASAAILDKLLRKNYGLKPVRVFTLLKKWMHEGSEADVEALVDRGNLEWTEGHRDAVNLVAAKLADTESIVELYRRRQH